MTTLTLSAPFADGALSVSVSVHDYDHPARRWQYRYVIAVDGATIAEGTDLRSGCRDMSDERGPDLPDALASVLSFAYVESVDPDSDDVGSWGQETAETLHWWREELSMLQSELGNR